jgi:hypothetical protein
LAKLRILVLGDGPNEVAREWQLLLSAEELPALPRLVHRLLQEPGSVSYGMGLFRRSVHGRGKGDVWQRKTEAAVRFAQEHGFDAVVILVDRDRQSMAVKFAPLAAGREVADRLGGVPCAIGCAIETFDAWMIVDGKAVGGAGGDASRSHPGPEGLDGDEGTGRHPKDRAIELFGRRDALTGAYAKVAGCVDLELLMRRCPKGFAPFAEEVRQRIAPVVAGC